MKTYWATAKAGLMTAIALLAVSAATVPSSSGADYEFIIFQDNLENFPQGWTLFPQNINPNLPGWTKSNQDFASPGYSAKCTPNAFQYGNNAHCWFDRYVSISGYPLGKLYFKVWQSTEAVYDSFFVKYYDGSQWVDAYGRAGSFASWQSVVLSLPNTTSLIRFGFKSDATVTGAGVYVDDIVLTGAQDHTPPQVAITAPANNSSVSGTTTITAIASDAAGVSKVEFYVDGVLKGTNYSAPYTCTWATAGSLFRNGHILQAKAYDPSGNVGVSAKVTVDIATHISIYKPWTVLMYLAGNNDLETYALERLEKIGEAILPMNNVRVIVQIEATDGCKRYLVKGDGQGNIMLQDLGTIERGDPQVLADFGKWALNNYPGNRRMLYLYDHGNGWYSGSLAGQKSYNHIGLANGEFSTAMDQITNSGQYKFDLIIWEACLMGMWEVMDICKKYSLTMIGSEDTAPFDAKFFINPKLGSLDGKPNQQIASVVETIVNQSYGFRTCSGVDLTKIDTLNTKVNALANQLITARVTPSYDNAINDCYQATLNKYNFYGLGHIDLYDYAINIALKSGLPVTLRQAAIDVMGAVTSSVIINRPDTFNIDAKGVAIYHSKPDGSDYRMEYNLLTSSQSTLWDEYIRGADSFTNYRAVATYFDWVTTTQPTGITLDDQAVTLNIPFAKPFLFYGKQYTKINVCSNGFVNFGTASTAYSPAAIPSTSAPNALLAPLWRDLNPADGGSITYKADTGMVAVTWEGVRNYSSAHNGTPQSFQVVFKPDGRIVMQWKSTTGVVPTTVGVENETGQTGVGCGQPANNTAKAFIPPAGMMPKIGNYPLEGDAGPGAICLANAPNPFTSKTAIRFQVDRPGKGTLRIFNLLGQNVRKLLDEEMQAGAYAITWNGKDDAGRKVAAGIYICRLEIGGRSLASKMTMIR